MDFASFIKKQKQWIFFFVFLFLFYKNLQIQNTQHKIKARNIQLKNHLYFIFIIQTYDSSKLFENVLISLFNSIFKI